MKEILEQSFGEETKKLLYDATTEVVNQYGESCLNAAIYLYFLQSWVEDTTLKDVFNKYCIQQYDNKPAPTHYTTDYKGMYLIKPVVEYECWFRLVKRDKPLDVSDFEWTEIAISFTKHLQDVLKV